MKSILQGIGIIFTLIASFLGCLYFLNGDIMISAFITSIIVVVLYFLQETFIKKKATISKNKLSSTSIILWTLYLLLSIPITFSLIHALNVELNEKKNIQQIAAAKQEDLTRMVDKFNAEYNTYLSRYELQAKVKLQNYKSSHDPKLRDTLQTPPYEAAPSFFELQEASVDTQARYMKKALFNKLDRFELGIKDTINAYKYKTVFSNWSRVQLSLASTELDRLLSQNHKNMVDTLAQVTHGNAPAFQYNYNKETISINQPKELWIKNKPYGLLIIVFLFHILILLPYIIEPVAGRYITPKKGNNTAGGGIQL